MTKERYIQLGHRFKVVKTPDHAIIDTDPEEEFDEVTLFCGHISGICEECWDKIIEKGWKALGEERGKEREKND